MTIEIVFFTTYARIGKQRLGSFSIRSPLDHDPIDLCFCSRSFEIFAKFCTRGGKKNSVDVIESSFGYSSVFLANDWISVLSSVSGKKYSFLECPLRALGIYEEIRICAVRHVFADTRPTISILSLFFHHFVLSSRSTIARSNEIEISNSFRLRFPIRIIIDRGGEGFDPFERKT